MASLHDDAQEVAFQEGMLCLPSHVLNEPCDDYKVNMKNRHLKQKQRRLPRESQSQYSKFNGRSSYERPKHAAGGPGMQAVFLVSGQGSCGTGVFLPQKAGTKSTRKPACAPVLLPARVVQALNLKVHKLGLQISPSQAPKYSLGGRDLETSESTKNKNDEKDDVKQCCGISQSRSSCDVFLPKEWTY